MKKLIALMLALLTVLTLCACGRPSGTYNCYMASLKFMTLEIEGDNITRIVYDVDGSTKKKVGGSFEMEGDEVVIRWDDGKGDRFTYDSGEEKLSMTDSFFFVKE